MTPEDSLMKVCDSTLDDRDIVTDPDILRSYSRDRSTGSVAAEPIGVVFPRSTEQVATVMAAAHKNRVPVVPRGAGSGLSGGSNAIEGSLVLCVERMRDVLDVNLTDGYVETQPEFSIRNCVNMSVAQACGTRPTRLAKISVQSVAMSTQMRAAYVASNTE